MHRRGAVGRAWWRASKKPGETTCGTVALPLPEVNGPVSPAAVRTCPLQPAAGDNAPSRHLSTSTRPEIPRASASRPFRDAAPRGGRRGLTAFSLLRSPSSSASHCRRAMPAVAPRGASSHVSPEDPCQVGEERGEGASPTSRATDSREPRGPPLAAVDHRTRRIASLGVLVRREPSAHLASQK